MTEEPKCEFSVQNEGGTEPFIVCSVHGVDMDFVDIRRELARERERAERAEADRDRAVELLETWSVLHCEPMDNPVYPRDVEMFLARLKDSER